MEEGQAGHIARVMGMFLKQQQPSAHHEREGQAQVNGALSRNATAWEQEGSTASSVRH